MTADLPHRIAFVTDASSDPLALGARSAASWAAELGRRGHEVQAARLTTAGSRPFDPTAVDAVVAVGTRANVAVLRRAARHEHGQRPVILATEDDLVSVREPSGSLAHRLLLTRARRMYRSADAVVTPSHPVAAEMAAAFAVPASRCLIVPPPVLASLPPSPARPTPASGRLRLVVPSGASPEDRDLVRRAAALLEAGGTTVDVVVTARDAVGEINAADLTEGCVVVDPRRRSGFSAALVEAAAHGVAGVGISSAIGPSDAVIPGVTGELALDDDPAEIAAAISRARHLTVARVDDWLGRFTVAASTDSLEGALRYARGLG